MRPRPDLAHYTDLTVTGHHDDITELVRAAHLAGVLVHWTAPQPAGYGDPRVRALIRLHLHHR